MTSPLAALLTPDAVTPFLERCWPETHTVTHGPLRRLPSFFHSPLLTDPRELSRAYRGTVTITNLGTSQYPVTSGPQPHAYFEDLGLSVRFDHVETMLPGAQPWLRELEAELGVPRGGSKMVAFANAPGSGLVVHCDPTEQFAIHLVGDKRFLVKPSPNRFQTMSHSPHKHVKGETLSQGPEGLPSFKSLEGIGIAHHLKPGSVLFTPRGLYHETLASNGVSLSLVIAIENPSPAELVAKYLQRTLLQSEAWRTPLRRGWSLEKAARAAPKKQLKALLKQLAPRLGNLNLDLMLGDHHPQTLVARDLVPTSRFQRDQNVQVTVTGAPDKTLVVTVPRTPNTEAASQAFPQQLRGVLTWLLKSKAALSLQSLATRFPRWDQASLAAVLVFFVRTRVFVFLPFQAFTDE